ncbi:hypothetical protein RJ641_031124 [Dillenia turbinata]|uniref:Uncharacterized protein n=1 Tax=Dillenia turbinata TaxID=194707 RepID=A0AAN8VXI6_9MAGN
MNHAVAAGFTSPKLNSCLSPNKIWARNGGLVEEHENLSNPSLGSGYKWRLVISYDGTQYAGNSQVQTLHMRTTTLQLMNPITCEISKVNISYCALGNKCARNFKELAEPCISTDLDAAFVSGRQYQQSPPTILFIVEKAFTQVTRLERKDLYLVGAGRTAAGVHAWGHVATLSHLSTMTAWKAFMQRCNEKSCKAFSRET